MISAFVTVALLGGALVSDDKTSTPVPDSVIVRVTESSFRAINASSDDRWLVIEREAGGAALSALLPAGAEVSWELEVGSTHGVTLDIVTVLPSGIDHTGPISIDLATTGGVPLLLTSNASHACSWALAGSAVFLGATSSVALGATAASTAACACSGAEAAAHVPVLNPLETTGQQRPPVLDPDPLPPI